jgi:thiazole synthase
MLLRRNLPDNEEIIQATSILANEGFIVFPLGAPIGSNRGLQTKEMIRIMIEKNRCAYKEL